MSFTPLNKDKTSSTGRDDHGLLYHLRRVFLFFEQVIVMCLKHVSQRKRNGRQFLKDSILIQFVALAFTANVLTSFARYFPTPHEYDRMALPPLSKSAWNGVFNRDAPGNEQYYQLSQRLYFAPSNHTGVQELVSALTERYPDVQAVGAEDGEGIKSLYEANLFDTWASLQFALTPEQLSSGQWVTSQSSASEVTFVISVNPTIWGKLPNYDFADPVYNQQVSPGDLFWNSGYLTLQKFVDTYLAQEYHGASNFTIDAFVQRYPKSSLYENKESLDLTIVRQSIWKWCGATILSVCLFVPMLSYLIEIVRERQYLMKDMLEISGLMNVSYWTSYMLILLLNGVLSIGVIVGLLRAFSVFDERRVGPYAALMFVYLFGSSAFAMMFGFLVPRSEYYGLPVFLLTVAFTVCGAYLGIAANISENLKLFFCFLSPSVGLTMGVLDIENYFFYHDGDMDYSYVNQNKAYPSLNEVIGVLVASGLFYSLLAFYLLPLDWVFDRMSSNMVAFAAQKGDDIRYPCDAEEVTAAAAAADATRSLLLDVQNLTQVYPDGTQAVQGVSFAVKEGEVLSFLGANGAGKSTCMKILCGALAATSGDAFINGYSITSERVFARRNLGIAMQQDVLWEDVNVEDHLLLFGRLRGLHGEPLRSAVDTMLQDLGFPEKRHSLAGTLSGGQKRRLCVGLSMVGGSAVVFLDEPTAGLDPVSRRQLWDLVRKNRSGRAILLTTHFMDEADVLGDRIAIVKEGRLRAMGTSRFLKERFGLGFLLRMSLQQKAAVDTTRLQQAIQQHVPQATVASSAGTELSLRLPREAIRTFPRLLERLEDDGDALGLTSFGIETTTLEEVFMRIVNEDTEQLLTDHARANLLLAASAEECRSNEAELKARDNQRMPLPLAHIAALLTPGANVHGSASAWTTLHVQVAIIWTKRYHQFVRSRGQWVMGCVIPIALAICTGLLISSIPTTLLASTTAAVFPAYPRTALATKVAGSTENATLTALASAIPGLSGADYVGQNYSALFASVAAVASGGSSGGSGSGSGVASVGGIAYTAANNFTVMFNASWPMPFVAAVTDLNAAAAASATDNLLTIHAGYNNLPANKLDGQLNSAFFSAMTIALIAASFGAGLSIVVSGERVTMVKHQQMASGTSHAAYWIGNFLWDGGVLVGYVLLFVAVLALFNPSVYTGAHYGEIVLPGLLCAIAVIFRFYSVSYFIPDVRMAQSLYFYGSLAVMYVLLQVFLSVLFTTAKSNIMNSQVQTVALLFSVVEPVFGWYLLILFQSNFLAVRSQNDNAALFSEHVGGRYLTMVGLSVLLYGGLFIFFTEGALWWAASTLWSTLCGANGCKPNGGAVSLRAVRPAAAAAVARAATTASALQPLAAAPKGNALTTSNPASGPFPVAMGTSAAAAAAAAHKDDGAPPRSVTFTDPDVLTERERVQRVLQSGQLDTQQSAIFVHNLRKVYYARGTVPAKVAVQDVSLSIAQGEIFGLLGANGAGKTTLLKIVSGLEPPSQGLAMIHGYNVVTQTAAAQRSMGLCPQFDTLIDRLTVRENLLFFGAIKGLQEEPLLHTVEAFLQALHIQQYEHKLIQQLSGGNRRKVSLAVALIGAPPTVYLDEPSTGLDPVASRLMWRLLSNVAAAKTTAVVLTTHNMLECEAVCSRVGIMKMGALVCLGDAQRLRSTHGTGFQLEVALLPPAAAPQSNNTTADAVAAHAAAVQRFVAQHFPHAVLLEEHGCLLNYEVPTSDIRRLSAAFRLLETHRDALGIADYSLSQSTLEQVFLKQIRPSAFDAVAPHRRDPLPSDVEGRTPRFNDYVTGYVVWALSFFFPGLHHYYLGNFWRGVKYTLSVNELFVGWALDLFEMHVLIQKSVQQYGHQRRPIVCNCCLEHLPCCYGCRPAVEEEEKEESSKPLHGPVAPKGEDLV